MISRDYDRYLFSARVPGPEHLYQSLQLPAPLLYQGPPVGVEIYQNRFIAIDDAVERFHYEIFLVFRKVLFVPLLNAPEYVHAALNKDHRAVLFRRHRHSLAFYPNLLSIL